MNIQRFISDKVDREARRYSEQHDCTYSIALHHVLDADPVLKAQYAGAPIKTAQRATPSGLKHTQREVGEEVHGLVTEYLTQHGNICSYQQALREVLANNPQLAKEYAACE
jgi:hypothetical protein